MIFTEEKDLAPLYVGIDISKKFFEICLMKADGKVLKTFEISSTKSGFDLLIKSIPDMVKPVFCMENTGPFAGNLFRYLEHQGFKCIVANPYDASKLRDAFSQHVKTDLIDAYVLAQAARMDVLKHSTKDEQYVELQDILERYHDLTERKTALINQLRASLVQSFPEIELIFDNIDCNASIAILSHYQSASQMLKVKISKIVEHVKNANGRVSIKKLEYLKDRCKDSVAWKQGVHHQNIIKSQIMELVLIRQLLKDMKSQLADYVAETFRTQFDLVGSVPGIGNITAYQLIAVIGDHRRFDPLGDGKGASRLSSFVGFGLKEYSSGSRRIKTGISKRGNAKVRGLLFMASFSAIRTDVQIACKYQEKKARGNGKKAAVAISHLLVRRVYGVLKSGKMYNSGIPMAG